ncbi:unnamed protein product [Effrenium voratum]|uniref:Uncharacterized protein n=1 Tax=Effrenium voratum TaxID=2562239 RepID=A0AA36IFK6_9DINO|nr:unnamed protein product [Effrenium voratum]
MDVQAYVERVRSFQKSSEECRKIWNHYCDTEAGPKMRDPKRHPLEFLQTFFEREAAGELDDDLEDTDVKKQKLSVALPEVSQQEVQDAQRRAAADGLAVWRSLPSHWQPLYEVPMKLRYDAEKFDFRAIARQLLECPEGTPLEKLHEVQRSEDFEACPPLQLGMTLAGRPAAKQDRVAWRSNRFRLQLREVYRRFVLEEILPSLAATGDSDAAVQFEPVLRVVMPGHAATKRHRDADYGHIPEELNFWLPLTSVAGSNSLYLESFPGRGDFHAFEGTNGDGFRWWGNLCEHYAEPNQTSCTRVSLDFRLIPGRFWAAALRAGSVQQAESRRSRHHGGSMAIGSYYTWLSLS